MAATEPLYKNSVDPERHFKRLIVSRVSLYLGIVGVITMFARNYLHPIHPVAWLDLVVALLILALPFYPLSRLSVETRGMLLIFLCSLFATVAGMTTGGMRAPTTVIMVITPIIGCFVSGSRGAVLAGVLGVLQVALLLVAEDHNWLLGPPPPPEIYSYNVSLIYIMAGIAGYAIGSAFFSAQKAHRHMVDTLFLSSLQHSKMASLGEMSAGIAHEINNPLAIISGTLPLLTQQRGDELKHAQKVEMIARAVTRIEHIVRGLKRFSRTNAQRDFKSADLKNIVNDAVAMAKFRNSEVSVSSEMERDLTILCDAIEIEQVVVNLVNNAIDAALVHKEKWVKVKGFSGNGDIILQVLDSGPGIDPKLANKLFQPFFTTKPVGQGTGLGLSITKGILEQHKATIRINPACTNTCFEIRFPNLIRIENAA